MTEECINTHDQMCRAKEAGLPAIWIGLDTFPTSSRSGGHDIAGWQVSKLGFDLDPSAKRPWYQYHRGKCFSDWDQEAGTRREQRALALTAAMAWAYEKFGIIEWKRNRMGDYVPAEVAKRFPLRRLK